MPNSNILSLLNEYEPFDEAEAVILKRIKEFVLVHDNCMDKSLLIGHVTGSSWIVDKDRTSALFTHHWKVNKWLQLGGHAEEETTIIPVAFREAKEESGLSSIHLISDKLFSIDIHPIPPKPDFPSHLHYDMRFLFEADINEPLIKSAESNFLKWISFEEIKNYNSEPAIMRMVHKSEILFQRKSNVR